MKLKVCNLKLHYLLVLPLLSGAIYAEQGAHSIERGGGHIHGVHKECALPKSQGDIVQCAIDFHPDVRRSSLKVESSEKLSEQASQVPNPTLSARYVKGDKNGEDVSSLEANLGFKIEVGGKRGSRINRAQAVHSQTEASDHQVKARVKTQTILNLHRLRQVFIEKKILLEATSAFKKVIGQLKRLPRLSAEQEASLTLFEMALEETKVSESVLFEEEREIEHFFHVSTGHSIDEIRPYLPKSPSNWPSVKKAKGNKLSPDLKKLKSLEELALSELEVQKSKSWSDIEIGPSISIEKEGSEENRKIGFNIQIPLPLFQANGGGKAYARSEVTRAQKSLALTRAEEGHERFEQLRVYESAVSTLKRTMKQSVIENKHAKIEKLYLRGVVSSSVFLDSLKQKLSYIISRNNRELTALRALWSIHKYDGKILEEKI